MPSNNGFATHFSPLSPDSPNSRIDDILHSLTEAGFPVPEDAFRSPGITLDYLRSMEARYGRHRALAELAIFLRDYILGNPYAEDNYFDIMSGDLDLPSPISPRGRRGRGSRRSGPQSSRRSYSLADEYDDDFSSPSPALMGGFAAMRVPKPRGRPAVQRRRRGIPVHMIGFIDRDTMPLDALQAFPWRDGAYVIPEHYGHLAARPPVASFENDRGEPYLAYDECPNDPL